MKLSLSATKLLLLFAVVLVCAGAALYFSPELNRSLFLSINAIFPNRWVWTAITTPGDGAVAGCLFYVLFRKHKDLLLKGLVGALVGTIASQGLKTLFAVARPEYTPDIHGQFHFLAESMAATNYSMPSGHTLTGFLLGIFIFCSVKLNLFGKIALVVAMVAIGISRIALGVHWPADVLVGAGLGIVIGLASFWLPVRVQSKWGLLAVHLLYFTFVVALFHQYFPEHF